MISEVDINDMWNDKFPPLNLNNLGPSWDQQVAGGHYKTQPIQPMAYSMANGLDALQHTIIKYVSRFREKGGLQDLDKAIHCINMLKEWEQREA